MAGYMTRLNGHVYEGMYPAGEALQNGMFAELTADGTVMKTTAAKDTKMRVTEKTTLWGMPALTLTVTAVGSDEVYLVEGEWDINDNAPYNEQQYATPAGTLVRMHRPLVGETMILTVEETLYGTLNAGDVVTPAAGGTVGI